MVLAGSVLVSETKLLNSPSYSCYPAQLGGMAIGLSVAGAVFVNQAVDGLQAVLPTLDRSDLIAAVSGTSSELFESLPAEVRKEALESIVLGLRQV